MHNIYNPLSDKSVWSGRVDAKEREYIYQMVSYLDLDDLDYIKLSKPGYAILGFACDEGVRRNLGRVGAKDGPSALRRALAKLPVHCEFNLYDAGDVICNDNNLEMAQEELGRRVSQIFALGLVPIVIGGGHETALGHYLGIMDSFSKEEVAILNFDAHFDLRELISGLHGSSGTPFRQINSLLKQQNKTFTYYCAGIQKHANTKSLFDYADNHNVKYLLAQDINNDPTDLSFIRNIINSHAHVYVTICLDVFCASLAPGVSAPQVLGIDAMYAIEALKILKNSNRVVSLDIVELAPVYDVDDNTSKLAAALLFNYLQ